MKNIVLRQLSPADGKDVYDMLQHIEASENDFTNPVHGMNYENYKEWLKEQDCWSRGENLPAGYVTMTIFWLIADGIPVGIGKIRHGLTPASREEGGNIGYAVDSRCRGNGYGTVLLGCLLHKAEDMGIKERLITIKKFNYASKKAVEKNGCKLTSETDGWWYYYI